jgi:hypothetical protein
MKRIALVLTFLLAAARADGQAIAQLEYYIDEDPGFGAAVQVTVSETEDLTSSFTVDLTGVAVGWHVLGIRARDADGRWGLTYRQRILVSDAPLTPDPAPQIVAGEYYLDDDPGYGLGEPVPVTPGGDITTLLSADVSGVPEGWHMLSVRAQDENGNWGLTYRERVLVMDLQLIPAPAPQVVAAEYYIDEDPGHGLGTPIAVTPGADVTVAISADVSDVTDGWHMLSVRAQDEHGNWGLAHRERVLIKDLQLVPLPPPEVVAAEYFIDEDPGHGLGTPIPLTLGEDIVASIAADVSEVAEGWHMLSVRALDETGSWGLTHRERILVKDLQLVPLPPPEIVAAEYYIGEDPGYGLGTPIPLLPGADVLASITADMSQVAEGWHRLSVRALDENGHWGLTHRERVLIKEFILVPPPAPEIVAAEYYIDTDPGYGLGTPIALTPDSDLSTSFTVDLSEVPFGLHWLYMRAQDESGTWSTTHIERIGVTDLKLVPEPPPKVVAIEYYFVRNQVATVPLRFTGFTPAWDVDVAFELDLDDLTSNRNYTVYVRAVDEHGRRSLASIQDITVTTIEEIALVEGWNLISLGKPSAGDSITTIVRSINGSLVRVVGFETRVNNPNPPDTGGKLYDPTVPVFVNTLILTDPQLGYWFKVSADDTLSVGGVPAKVVAASAPGADGDQGTGGGPHPVYDFMGIHGSLLVDGTPAPPGTLVEVIDGEGNLAGATSVRHEGYYGFLPIYRNSPSTDVDEGADQGEWLRLRVNGQVANQRVQWTGFGDVAELHLELRSLPEAFALRQNYPNPFNPRTTIAYELPEEQDVLLRVFSITGQVVRDLGRGTQSPGYYSVTWDGRDDSGRKVGSGVYLYRLWAGSFAQTRKLVLVK